ncbi:MAG: biotin--[acetyl-CoA-carboxylase] ligase [Baekduia sp.]
MTLGLPRLHLAETGSTNTLARELAEAGAPHGTLVSAGIQTAGRGRQGRGWRSPAGSLSQSYVLRLPQERVALLPLAAAVAVAELCGPDALVKWPNDVWLEPRRKVAGILAETRGGAGWQVLGIGINVAVAAADLGDDGARAATLGASPAELPAWRDRLTDALETVLAQSNEQVVAAWRERDGLIGRTITWDDGHGIAAGIDDEGQLLVETSDGTTQALIAGEVHLSLAP